MIKIECRHAKILYFEKVKTKNSGDSTSKCDEEH